jgi:hypothetical protein
MYGCVNHVMKPVSEGGGGNRHRPLSHEVFEPVAVSEFCDSEDSKRQIGGWQHDKQ